MSKSSRSLCMSQDTRVDHFNITENLPMAQILQSAASRWQMPVFERLTNSTFLKNLIMSRFCIK